jgi:hypothetical protein
MREEGRIGNGTHNATSLLRERIISCSVQPLALGREHMLDTYLK